MNIPDSFKTAQQAVFQDKTITHHAAVTAIGVLNTETVTPAQTPAAQYTVRVQPVHNELQAQEQGLTAHEDIIIRSSAALPIPKGDFVRYGECFFRVVARVEHDAYTELNCKRVGIS